MKRTALVLVFFIAFASFSDAQVTKRQKVVAAWGSKVDTVAKRDYDKAVREMATECGKWSGTLQAGSDAVVGLVNFHFIAAAICNY